MRNRSFERGPKSYPDEKDKFPEFVPEEPKTNPNFDINPEEHLIQEDEVEEIYKKKPGDETPMPEKKMSDIEKNERIVELSSEIKKLKEASALSKGQKIQEEYEKFLKVAEREYDKLGGPRP